MPYKRTTAFTRADIIDICAAANPASYAADPIISSLRPRFTAALRDRQFDIRFADGESVSYRFDRFGLAWREDEGPWNEEYAECMESTRAGVFFIHHLRTHILPHEAATLVLDTNTGLAALVFDRLGKASQTRDVDRRIRFGWYGERPSQLHSFSDELIGKVIDWKFAEDYIIHTLYCNIQCLAFISPVPQKAGGWEDYFPTFNPANYVKIAEDLYLVSFYAPHACGMETSMLIDLAALRSLGASFGIDSRDKYCSYTFGAKGAYAALGFVGQYTVH